MSCIHQLLLAYIQYAASKIAGQREYFGISIYHYIYFAKEFYFNGLYSSYFQILFIKYSPGPRAVASSPVLTRLGVIIRWRLVGELVIETLYLVGLDISMVAAVERGVQIQYNIIIYYHQPVLFYVSDAFDT